MVNVIMIIGSICFMMLHQNKSQFYDSLIFEFGIFSLVRLVVVCTVGNMLTNSYRDLVRVIFENVCHWNSNGWMCFMEIKQMKSHFTVTFLSVYSVRQRTILSVMGFALSYIVVLLQTENYGTAIFGTNQTVDN